MSQSPARQAKRHPPRAPAVVPNMGTFHQVLEPPEIVGELSVGEATELRGLVALDKRLGEDLKHAQMLVNLSAAHLRNYARGIVGARGLDLEDLYSVNDETGTISRTHVLVRPQPEAVEAAPDSAEA